MNPVIAGFTAFGGCVVGSLFPLVNTELLVLGLAAAVPATLLIPVAVLASAGQVTGQSILYAAGRGSRRLSGWRQRPRVAAVLEKLAVPRTSTVLMLASATAGVPPLTATSVACGMLRIDVRRFVAIVFAGRLIRNCLLVSVPHLVTQVA